MKILFLSAWYPFPADNGSKIRIWNLLQHLAGRHEVDLISFASEPVEGERLAEVQRCVRQVQVAPFRAFQPGRLKALAGFLSPRPRAVVDTFSPEMRERVRQAGQQRQYDLVIASQIYMAPYALAAPGVPRLLEEAELTKIYEDYALQTRPWARMRGGLTWWKQARYTASLLRQFDGCTVVSSQERERVQAVSPGFAPVEIIPNGVDGACLSADYGEPQPDTLIYAGALTYFANLDAVEYFLRQVMPLVRQARPQAALSITGKLDGVRLGDLASLPGAVLTGYLPDVWPAVARSWASVAPLRLGGGTRLKVLESLGLGTPVVATPKGAEGLDLVPGRDILLADEPGEMAAAVVRLLGDPELRRSLARDGRQAVAGRYDWDSIGRRFCDVVERVVRGERERA